MEDEKGEVRHHGREGGPHHAEAGHERECQRDVQGCGQHRTHRDGPRFHAVELIVHGEAVQKDAVLPDGQQREQRNRTPIGLGRHEFENLRRDENECNGAESEGREIVPEVRHLDIRARLPRQVVVHERDESVVECAIYRVEQSDDDHRNRVNAGEGIAAALLNHNLSRLPQDQLREAVKDKRERKRETEAPILKLDGPTFFERKSKCQGNTQGSVGDAQPEYAPHIGVVSCKHEEDQKHRQRRCGKAYANRNSEVQLGLLLEYEPHAKQTDDEGSETLNDHADDQNRVEAEEFRNGLQEQKDEGNDNEERDCRERQDAELVGILFLLRKVRLSGPNRPICFKPDEDYENRNPC